MVTNADSSALPKPYPLTVPVFRKRMDEKDSEHRARQFSLCDANPHFLIHEVFMHLIGGSMGDGVNVGKAWHGIDVQLRLSGYGLLIRPLCPTCHAEMLFVTMGIRDRSL